MSNYPDGWTWPMHPKRAERVRAAQREIDRKNLSGLYMWINAPAGYYLRRCPAKRSSG